MRLRELYEAPAQRVVAVMPGGFHPFHPGHKSLYDWAVKTFGQANVYVAATNDTKTRPFPFDVKKELAGMAGVPGSNFIQVKSPFNAREYENLVNDMTALVFVRSEKDRGEQPKPDQTKRDGTPGYLRTFTNLKDLESSDVAGYMAYGPTIDFDFSGMKIKSASELRAKWPEMSDDDKLQAAKLMYGDDAKVAVALLNKALGDPEAPVDEGLFGKTDNASVKEQDPNKLKVLDWIAARADGQEHFLSFYRKGAAWSGKLMFIKPDEAAKFMRKVEDNPDYMDVIKKALTSLVTTGKLFDKLGVKYQVRNAD